MESKMAKKRRQSPIFKIFQTQVLNSKVIKEMAFEQTIGDKRDNPDYIKKHFSEFVVETEKRAYEIFLETQNTSAPNALAEYLFDKMPETLHRDDLLPLFEENFEAIDSFFLSLSQSRKARAGYSFQYTIKELFKLLNYTFAEEPVINGQPDFLFPSVDHYQKNSIDCIIFTVKRIVRERWRQVTNEGTRGLGFYLATIDSKITVQELPRIKDNKINLVVPDTIKNEVPHYREADHVLTFESFILDKLDPADKAWRRRGIIS